MKSGILLLMFVMCCQMCYGITVHVPSDCADIQAGIDTASTGDTVMVADGTYQGVENRDIDFGGKGILLLSENGPEFTIIDCNATSGDPSRAFHFHSGEDSSAVVDGFTIKDAFIEEQGAIQIISSSPIIRNCIIIENGCSGIQIEGETSFPHVDACIIRNNAVHGVAVGSMASLPGANLQMSHSLVCWNTSAGLYILSSGAIGVSNCTILANGMDGIAIEGEAPRGSGNPNQSKIISNCIFTNNNGYGISMFLTSESYLFYCNNSWGNDSGDYVNVDAYSGDYNGNLSVPPIFCDVGASDFHIHETSICAPSNNDCGVLIGAYDVGCADYLCGDVNRNKVTFDIADVVVLGQYIAGTQHIPGPVQNADVDLCGSVNVSDYDLVMREAFGLSAVVCEQYDPCYLPTGGNMVSLECPIIVTSPFPDSVAMPIYFSNDTSLVAISLGFSYDSDQIEIASFDPEGWVMPEDWFIDLYQPTDDAYIHPVEDSNTFMLYCSRIPSTTSQDLLPQSGGLLGTLWVRIDTVEVDYSVDFDSSFFYPAGEFIFALTGGGAIRPDYIDCGVEDLKVGNYLCGDADASGGIDIDDVVYLIAYVFQSGPEPQPLEYGDVDLSGFIDIDDIVYLIDYIFQGGPTPCEE